MTYQFYNIPAEVSQIKTHIYEPYNRLLDLQSKEEVFKKNVNDCTIFLNASAEVVEEFQTIGAWKNWDKTRKKCDYHKKVLKEIRHEYEKEKSRN